MPNRYAYIPAAPSSAVSTSGGQIQLSAPVGGNIRVEGKTVSILKIDEAAVEYSIQ